MGTEVGKQRTLSGDHKERVNSVKLSAHSPSLHVLHGLLDPHPAEGGGSGRTPGGREKHREAALEE